MNLVISALIVSWAIALFTLLPWFFAGIRNQSRLLLVLGSAVLFGVIFFDLIPEMMEIGGFMSLGIMLASWATFSVIHKLQHANHENHSHAPHEHGGAGALVWSMAMHCFSGGMFLVTSYEISERLAVHVFWGLLVHKVFEALAISSVLLEKIETRRQLYLYTAIYAFSFPAGVIVTSSLRSAFAASLTQENIEMVAMVITSVAVGSLMGCLVQDFLLPAVRGLRRPAVVKYG